MTDAFKCDRCGELYGEPPEVRVATNKTEGVGGGVVLKKQSSDKLAGVAPTHSVANATYEIKRGDLCEDCAEDFRDFWGGSDD